MRAEIRETYSSDVDDLSEWLPTSEAFAVVVRLQIGPAGEPGEESFDVTVCSPSWLGQQAEDAPVLDVRHHLVVREFSWPVIRDYITARVAACTGETWSDVTLKLSRFAYWEFEDYT